MSSLINLTEEVSHLFLIVFKLPLTFSRQSHNSPASLIHPPSSNHRTHKSHNFTTSSSHSPSSNHISQASNNPATPSFHSSNNDHRRQAKQMFDRLGVQPPVNIRGGVRHTALLHARCFTTPIQNPRNLASVEEIALTLESFAPKIL
jgi:hypothetical protein